MQTGYVTQFYELLLTRRSVTELPKLKLPQVLIFTAICALITMVAVANPWVYPKVYIGLCLYMALDALPHYAFLSERGLGERFTQFWLAIQATGTFFRMCFALIGLLFMHHPVFLVIGYAALAAAAIYVFIHIYSTGFAVERIHAVGYFGLITLCLWAEILCVMLILSTMMGGLTALSASVLAIGH
ncbi:MAG: hypothetical protein V4490_02920 [Pseudomonadota bacterium]